MVSLGLVLPAYKGQCAHEAGRKRLFSSHDNWSGCLRTHKQSRNDTCPFGSLLHSQTPSSEADRFGFLFIARVLARLSQNSPTITRWPTAVFQTAVEHERLRGYYETCSRKR